MNKSSPLKVFITYSHRNRAEKDELKISLSLMGRKGEIEIWHDNEMLAGDKWSENISESLAKSDILLYLVSRYSLDSENCNKELAEALQKDKKVIPIILEDCDWQSHELSGFEVLPNKGKAINEWTPESKGWQNVVNGIRETVKEMQKAKAEPPDDGQEKIIRLAVSLFQQANFLVMLGQFDQAIKAYSEIIEVIPDYADAYNNRGTAYAKTGDYEQAIADFDKAIALKPDYAAAYNNRGTAYVANGNPVRAIADYGRAIALKPDNALAYNNRGTAYAAKGDSVQAIADYDNAIVMKPDLAEAYNNRGTAYRGKGEYGSAIADYTRAIEINPDLAEAYYNRGLAYSEQGKDRQAIADYTRAIELKPDLAETYLNRGITYIYLQQWENAKKNLQDAKDKGMDIVTPFREGFGGVEGFEQITGITLPPDIKALLTKP